MKQTDDSHQTRPPASRSARALGREETSTGVSLCGQALPKGLEACAGAEEAAAVTAHEVRSRSLLREGALTSQSSCSYLSLSI